MDVVPSEAQMRTSRCEKGHEQQQVKVWHHAGLPCLHVLSVTLPRPAGRSLRVPRSLCPRPAAAEAPLLPREVAADGHRTRLAIPGSLGAGNSGSMGNSGNNTRRLCTPARENPGSRMAELPGNTLRKGSQLCALRATAAEPATDGRTDVARNLVPTGLHLSTTTMHRHSRQNLFRRHKKQDICPLRQQKPRVQGVGVKFLTRSTYSTYSYDGPPA